MPKTSKKKKRKLPSDPYAHLLVITRPLLELFATLDDVFTEENAFDNDKIKKGMGRLYREWKRVRTIMDPDFDPHKWSHKRRKQARKRGLSVGEE